MSRLIGKAINPLVGLASEAYAHNKAKKAQSEQPTSSSSQTPSDAPPAYDSATSDPSNSRRSPSPHSDRGSDSGDETDNDEDDWMRDETQDQLLDHSTTKEAKEPPKLLKELLTRHPDHMRGAPFHPLPCPVIVPQRRPNAKSRGFVRAYAPVLQDSGIDQATFLDFINSFESAINGQQYFNAFNAAVAISVIAETAAHGPDPIVHFAAMAIHISVEAGRRVYETYKTNGYLDLMNEHLFKPHGLYAVIMSYKPGSSNVSQVVNFQTNSISAVAAREGEHSKFRTAAGKSTEDQLPECAPLVFPQLEQASDEQKANAFKRSMAFIGNYNDKRAQAEWQQKNPDSKLNVPGAAPQFASSHGGPRHDAYSGGVIHLLTNGKAGGRRAERRAYRQERRQERREMHAVRTGREYKPTPHERRKAQLGVAADDARSIREIRRDHKQKRRDQGLTPISCVKRTLGEDVLYLMILNMPSEQEMEEARSLTKKSGIFEF